MKCPMRYNLSMQKYGILLNMYIVSDAIIIDNVYWLSSTGIVFQNILNITINKFVIGGYPYLLRISPISERASHQEDHSLFSPSCSSASFLLLQ